MGIGSAGAIGATSEGRSAAIAMTDMIWFPPIKGCQCAICQRRRRELKKADRLESELVDEDKLLRESENRHPW